MNEPVYLIDAYSLIYRSYFAFMRNPLRNSEGKNVSAVYGFFRTLLSLLKEKKPRKVAIIMDSRVPTFRHRMYEQYKATRQKPPPELHTQIPIIEEILNAMGLFTLRKDGYEADDIIASYVETLSREGIPCYILSGDKDILQLVRPGVTVLHPERGVGSLSAWGEREVLENRGIRPDQIVDYLALAGDQADNIPGVKGIGDKTAVKLLNKYGNLDGIYEHIEDVKPEGLKKKLIEGRESALLSRKLATLKSDIDVKETLPSLEVTGYKTDEAVSIFAREGMKSIVEELGGSFEREISMESASDKSMGKNYILVDSEELLDECIERAGERGIFSFDVETTSLDELESKPLGFSISYERGNACYIPLKADGQQCIPEDTVKEKIKHLLENKDSRIVGQNIKFDYKVLKRWGIEMANIYFDTMIASWLIDATSSSYGMDRLAERYLNYRTIHYGELFEERIGKGGKGGKKKLDGHSIDEVPIEKVVVYACEDADITLRLYEKFKDTLKEEKLETLFYSVEMPLVKVLAEMELAGIKLLPGRLSEYGKELAEQLNEIEKKIFELCGRSFNINSTKQLQTVLFEWRELKPVKKTKTGYSTDMNVLRELASEDPVPALVLEHRMLSKLKSTYVDALPLLVNKRTGRIHTHYIQTGTATGRLSSKDPNLQNIPIREEEGRRIRSAFVAEDGYTFLSADYSQIELAVLAYLSQDPMLLKAFREKSDIHRQTASLIFNVPLEEVDSRQRRIGKTINFGVIYGMSAYRLARDLKISRSDADRFIATYFAKYAGVSRYIEESIRDAEKKGYVTTILGRKRRIPQINSENKTEKMAAERVAINTPIQGSAADIVKLAMVNVHEMLGNGDSGSRLILQVHDELVLEVPDEELEEMKVRIKDVMENVIDKPIPLAVSIETGKSWGDLH